MERYPWNRVYPQTREFWDADIESPEVRQTLQSLKYRLESPSGRTDEVIGDIARGLAMIMDKIEELENK